MPIAIPALRDTFLSPETYEARLAGWELYLKANPSSGFAATQVARGLRYLRRDPERQTELTKSAVAQTPECPEALDSMASLEIHENPERALERLGRAIELAPEWHVPHLGIWNIRMVQGEDDLARKEIAQAHAKGAFPQTLMDFAHNLLVGGAEGSILLTNGDNDTYPLFALQAVYGFRTDIAVINLSMLNLPAYAERLVALGVLEDSELLDLQLGVGALPTRILDRLIEKGSRSPLARPVQLAVTAADHVEAQRSPISAAADTIEPRRSHFRLEGLLLNLVPGEQVAPVDVARTLELARTKYRLESIVDYSRRESPIASARRLSNNYAAMFLAAAEEAVAQSHFDAANEALDRTVHVFVQLGDRSRAEEILEYWQKVSAQNPQAALWTSRVAALPIRKEGDDGSR